MKISIYDNKDLDNEEKEGYYYNTDFAYLIVELLKKDELDSETEEGIAKKVQKEGTINLSKNQLYHIQKIFDRYNHKRCNICGDSIPPIDVLLISNTLCSNHYKYMQHD